MEQEPSNNPDSLEDQLQSEFAAISKEAEDTPKRFALIKTYIKDVISSLEVGDFDNLLHKVEEYSSEEELEKGTPTIREVADPKEKAAYYITACHLVFNTGEDEIEEVLGIASDWEVPDTIYEHKQEDWDRMLKIIKSWQ